jgi:hypothetical protein
MTSLLAVPETLVGLLLVFFAPGYFATRAVFPEWRLVPPDPLRRLLETVTLSFVLSVVFAVLVGELLLTSSPGGFQASWGDPRLEIVLALIAVAGLVSGLARGAYARTPVVRAPSPAPGEEGAWELTRDLDRLSAEERRLTRRLRELPPDSDAAGATRHRLEELGVEREALGRQREEQYAE